MGRLTNLSTCTIQLDDGPLCGEPSAQHMPFPICGSHASQLYRHVAKILGDTLDDPTFRAAYYLDHVKRDDQRLTARAAQPHHVYYVQVGDLIKIGYTSALKQRMASYPPGKRLLATETGDRRVELRRLGQFAAYRAAGDEWFHPSAELLAHINKLRQRSGEEPLQPGPQ